MANVANHRQNVLFGDPFHSRVADPKSGEVFACGATTIHFDRVEIVCGSWPTPTCIISDGPYGVSGFPGDEHKAERLDEWYRPHIELWSKLSSPQTTLWFWNTELGWATVHPLLAANGW